MAKPKYSPETKLAVVNHYLSGKDGEQSEFKLVVVRAVISDRLTMREAAARFNLSAEILVRRWLDVYNDAGAEGLLNIQCGRPGKMTKPKNIPPLTDKELEKLSPEELRAELRYLRAENAYLKKLKALV
ncbi:transposase, partial [Klebsiella pneumoniae]